MRRETDAERGPRQLRDGRRRDRRARRAGDHHLIRREGRRIDRFVEGDRELAEDIVRHPRGRSGQDAQRHLRELQRGRRNSGIVRAIGVRHRLPAVADHDQIINAIGDRRQHRRNTTAVRSPHPEVASVHRRPQQRV